MSTCGYKHVSKFPFQTHPYLTRPYKDTTQVSLVSSSDVCEPLLQSNLNYNECGSTSIYTCVVSILTSGSRFHGLQVRNLLYCLFNPIKHKCDVF